MTILLCQFGNETNTFAPGRLNFEMLAPQGWTEGKQVEAVFSGTRTYLGGALQAIADAGETALPIDLVTNNGNFGAGPLMTGECAQRVVDRVCACLEEKNGQFDGIYFAIHGAGCCELDEDLESYTLRRVRQVVGREMPIVCSLDLHANVTEEMCALADAIFCIKEVPHTDCYEAGYQAAYHLAAWLRNRERPVMAMRKLPLLLSPVLGSTLTGPGKQVKEYFAQYCREHDLLDCSFVHGFSATDRSCSSASVLVIADGYAPEEHAQHLADYVWNLRNRFADPDVPDAAGAVEAALQVQQPGYVIINEGSDNPGSGGPGDATHLLREFLRRDLPGTIMGPMYDPEVAEYLHTCNVGDRVSIRLGGKTMALAGAPLEIEDAEILNLCEGNFISEAPINKGLPMSYGKSARLRKGNVEFIVVSVRYQILDEGPFRMTGADLKDYRIVGLKSMNHFRGYFTSRAAAIISADTPGARPGNILLYPYEHVQRPIYPLDRDTQWP